MGRKRLYREYDDVTGALIRLECSHCREIKTIDNFNKCKSRKDGYDNKCKECEYKRYNNFYANNKEKFKEWRSEYYENNKEKLKEYQRQYYENNK